MDEKQGQSMELASIFLIHRKLHPMNQNLFREKLDILIFLRIIKNANKLQIQTDCKYELVANVRNRHTCHVGNGAQYVRYYFRYFIGKCKITSVFVYHIPFYGRFRA